MLCHSGPVAVAASDLQHGCPWKFGQAEVVNTQQVGIPFHLRELSMEGALMCCCHSVVGIINSWFSCSSSLALSLVLYFRYNLGVNLWVC